jgi:SOS response regulatory protein OraA/RecX
MPVVTALHEERGGRVRVELDGQPWRTLPTDVVVQASLRVDAELDRSRARAIARGLRRRRALDVAVRALRRRDRSRADLAARLERAGATAAAREHALDALDRAGLVDDARFAVARATGLAGRGFGDDAVRARLLAEGIDEALAGEALASLEPEHERASRIVAARGPGLATARLLARRGFGEDAVEAAAAGQGV